jgi:hypothetical protein
LELFSQKEVEAGLNEDLFLVLAEKGLLQADVADHEVQGGALDEELALGEASEEGVHDEAWEVWEAGGLGVLVFCGEEGCDHVFLHGL